VSTGAEFGTPLFIYDDRPCVSSARLPRRLPRAHRRLRDRLCEQGVQLPRHGRVIAQEICRSTWPPAASWRRRAAAFPPRASTSTATQVGGRDRVWLDTGIGQFVVDSFEEIEGSKRPPGARRPPEVLVRVTPGVRLRRTTTCRPASRQQVRLRLRRLRARRCAAFAAQRTRARRHPCTSARNLRPELVPREIRGAVHALDDGAATPASSAASSTWRRLGIRYTEPTCRAPSPSSPNERHRRPRRTERHGMAMPRISSSPGVASPAKPRHRLHVAPSNHPGVRTTCRRRRHERQPAPMLYDSRYEAMLASKARARRPTWSPSPASTANPATSGARRAIAPPEPGDILVTPSTGLRLLHANNYNANLGRRRHGRRRSGARDHRARDLGRRAASAAPADSVISHDFGGTTVDK